MKISLISLEGKDVTFNVAFPHLYNRFKVKKLIKLGYSLKTTEDADIFIKLKLY